MKVEVTSHGVVVTEVEVLTALSVQSVGISRGELDDALDQHGSFDGQHAWVLVDVLRASGPADAAWLADFAEMIAYAERSGWLSPTGSHVRAHVEDQ